MPGVDLLLSDPSKVDPELAKKSLPGDDPRYKTMGGWHDESVVENEDLSCKMAASIARLTGKKGYSPRALPWLKMLPCPGSTGLPHGNLPPAICAPAGLRDHE